MVEFPLLLLMEEILHHLTCMKPHKSWNMDHIIWCRISSINSMLVSGRVILDLFKGYLQKITVRLTEANRWGYCSLGWCLRRWWRGGTRMVWGVVMSQWEGRVKKGRKDPKFGMRCMELMALVWYGASIWPASVHASRISASSLVCCIAMSRSNSHEIPWKSYHPLKLT